MIKWSFPHNNYGSAAGANTAAIDTFAGTRLSSVVREIIQNSLDVAKNSNEPVRIRFSLETVDKQLFDGFEGIEPHLKACSKMAEQQGLDDAVNFYERGLEEIKKSRNVNVLCVHDYNTIGLEGPIDGTQVGSWFALIKGAGISQKTTSGSLGSFGHGSKAPFSYSQTRTIFYYSRIEQNGKIEDRFQGKSILQSHGDPSDPEHFTQGEGYYGHVEKLQPLINDEIPEWAREIREKVTDDTGTSIYVPYTEYSKDLYPETKITVIANFFFAIRSGALEVTVGDDPITKETVVKMFEDCEAILHNEQDEIDVTHIEDCFKSINTILRPDHHNTQEVKGFGRFTWFLRVGDDLEKKVGLARNSGMLITRRPPDLRVFYNVKPFDMFVCVDGQDGSEFLKRLENPTHDNFEFDRIKLPDERKQVRRTYKNFRNKIRDIINSYAELDNNDEEGVSDLGFLFSDVSDTETNIGKNFERGEQLLIRDGAFKRNSSNSSSGAEKDRTVFDDASGDGRQGGDNIENTGSTTLVAGKSKDDETTPQDTKHIAQNFRAVHSGGKKNKAKLYFDSPVSGICVFSVSIVGENGVEPVKFLMDGKQTSGIEVDLTKSERYNIEVEFAQTVDNLALEATLIEQEVN